jgi:hypothetical protein
MDPKTRTIETKFGNIPIGLSRAIPPGIILVVHPDDYKADPHGAIRRALIIASDWPKDTAREERHESTTEQPG